MASATGASGTPHDKMEAFQAFLQSPRASDLVKKQVFSMITDIKVVHDTTEDYSRDVARKIEKIREIQRDLYTVDPEFTFNPVQVALLLQTDYTVLCDIFEERDFMAMLTFVEPFVRCCLGRPGELDNPNPLKRTQSDAENDENDNGRGHEMDDDEKAELGETSEKTKGEDGNEINVPDDKLKETERKEDSRAGAAKLQVRIRDNNMCVFTESGPAEAAHIVPHTINKNERHASNSREALGGFLYAYRRDLWDSTKNLIVPLKNKTVPIILASDMEWNMFLLYYDVHKLFDNIIVGFKPIKAPRRQDPEDPSKEFICVEWRYLPKKVGQAFKGKEDQKFLKEKPSAGRPAARCKMDVFHDELVDFYERNMQDSRPDELGKGFSNAFWKDGTLIESGHRFHIPAYKKDADKTFHLLEVMWLASQIASLSGAAEAIRYLRERPDEEWKKAYQAMEQRILDRGREMTEWGRAADAAKAQDEDSVDEEGLP